MVFEGCIFYIFVCGNYSHCVITFSSILIETGIFVCIFSIARFQLLKVMYRIV